MKQLQLLCTIVLINICASSSPLLAQKTDSLGLPGDNLDLNGVLDLFKKSDSPEAFEKALNNPDTKLNNLDLNGDNETDYIRVIDHTQDDLHALVLQTAINSSESQDIAVIEIEKKADGTTHLQIVGDEELYGKNYIIEPVDENKTSTTSTSISASETPQTQPSAPPTVVNIYSWPAVRYIYRPVYSPWVSPWRWGYYPPAWRPWRPVFWGDYHPYWHNYHMYNRRVYTYGVVRAHDMYYGHRVVSRTVYQKRSSLQRPENQINNSPRTNGQQRSPNQKTSSPRNQRQHQQVNSPRNKGRNSKANSSNNRGGGGSGRRK